MLIGLKRFNIYLALAAFGICLTGCKSTSSLDKKPVASISLHMETNPGDPQNSSAVPIFRENPTLVTVEKTPFLTEADVAEARVINVLGGFAIQVKFNDRGIWMLEQYTAAHPGRRIGVLCRWGKRFKEVRWLAAPSISRRISDGTFIFTPDATREESEQIVAGLNTMAQEAAKQLGKW